MWYEENDDVINYEKNNAAIRREWWCNMKRMMMWYDENDDVKKEELRCDMRKWCKIWWENYDVM